ncbi:MAG: hypothetical protein ACKVRN_07500 [Pyrinomonadaceae bacterium]
MVKSITYDGANGVAAFTEFEYANTGVAGSPLNVINKLEYSYEVSNDSSGILPLATPHLFPLTIPEPTGTPARITHTDYKTDTDYLERGFLKLPIEVVVTNGAGSVKAKSQIVYDEPARLQSDPAVGVPGWSAPEAPEIRGLPTTTKNWYDLPNQFIETRVQYNQFGSPRINWDGNGNLTEIQYDDNFSDGYNHNTFALPTKAISAPANPSETPFETRTEYWFEAGLVTNTTDINGQTTSISYRDPATNILDPLLRQRKVTAPNGQQTITEYGQPDLGTGQYLPTQRFVMVKSQIDETKWKEGKTLFDGLGRTVQTQSLDTETGHVFVETEYDDVGRPWRTSNPYRTNDTKYWTTNEYDPAGRLWKVFAPDSDPVVTTYGVAISGGQIGTVTTVTDQAGKMRRSITDALGHLIRVDEPKDNPSPNPTPLGPIDNPLQPTYYEYDILNNLTKVKQGGTFATPEQTREFIYDALSRLKSADNPESGTINYVYDNNGNLTQKTDARGVRTTYLYDGLNRVKQRNYSAPSGLPNYQAAPDVTYFYDNITNGKGKLTKVTNGTGVDHSTTEYTSFDIMGRVTGHKQTTDGNQYSTSYAYNLAGALIEETYPSGRKVKNFLDGNGDLSTVKSRKSGEFRYWNYASDFHYNAAGAVTALQLGNGLYERTQYNNRLQPTQITLGSWYSGHARLLKLDYAYGDWVNGQIDLAKNNGNIAAQVITVPNNNELPNFVASQFYTYDELNRLKSATETISNTQTWKQTFNYDRYGNRRFDFTPVNGNPNTTVPASNCVESVCNPTFDTTKNQFASGQGWAYDATGNTRTDAQGKIFTYDGENKQVKVKNSSNVTVGEYFYDGDGKRVKKIVPGSNEVTIFVYNAAGNLVAEYSTNILPVEQAKVAYLTNDHLGSPRINTDRNGRVISRHDYHPFGEEIITPQRVSNTEYTPDTIRKQFTGYERDRESELDFAQARMYANTLGRFTSVDPFNPIIEFQAEDEDDQDEVEEAKQKFAGYLAQPQHWNRYSYALNNPLFYVDPDGENPLIIPVVLVIIRFAPAIIAAGRYLASPQGQRAIQFGQRQGANLANLGLTRGGAISNNVFKLNPLLRGNVIEGLLGVSDDFANGFPVIDKFIRNGGVATSIKSLDIGAQSYRNANQLTSTLTKYVKQLANFQSGRRNGVVIEPGDIKRRILQIVLPNTPLSVEQKSVLLKVQQDAARRGIEMVYVQAK